MRVRVGFDIAFDVPVITPMVLLLSIHPDAAVRPAAPERLRVEPDSGAVNYLDVFGNRCTRLVVPPGPLRLSSDTLVEMSGEPDLIVPNARQSAVEDLPDETLQFLLASRYCEVDRLSDTAWRLFGESPPGWARVQAVCDWVQSHVTYGYEFASPTKTAWDVYQEAGGVCRDFQHLAIAFCRALNIPARYTAGYLGDIGITPDPRPMDFHAWFEAYLVGPEGGRWYDFDARWNTPRRGRILMARGRDAVDVALSTSFGPTALRQFTVIAEEIKGG